MKIIIVKDYQQLSQHTANMVAEVVQNNPDAVLGLATGSTPIGCYQLLADMANAGAISFAKVSAVNLDEYVGLPATHNQSYAYFMRCNLFDKVDINLANTHIPNGMATDCSKECNRYDALLEKLPRNLQILGLGSNGHIGFNEPNTPFDSLTHLVNLAPSTIKDNARLFDDVTQVPTRAYTMGIAQIMQAKKVVIMANGANKAQAVKAMVQGPVDVSCPASVLQNHPDCTVILDTTAASLLD